MVTALAIDVGSSSVKAAVLQGTEPISPLVRAAFRTRYDGLRADVDAREVLRAVGRAAKEAVRGSVGRPVDVVALSAMSPSWVAIDRDGEALTPVVTHQDRRSLDEARRIEKAVGYARHMAVTGNRPVPGGISSTTAAWFARHERPVMRKAHLVGHLQTLLIRQMTGARAMDPSNASFTGLWNTTALDAPTDGSSGWDEDLARVAGVKVALLPAVLPGDAVAGELDGRGARMLGLRRGTAVLTGVVDTSAAILLGGAAPGTLFNACGSTDVLAMVTQDPRPGPEHLTRHLGVGQTWVHVMTISAAGSAILWAKSVLFGEMKDADFFRLLAALAKRPPETSVRFEPHLAGSRTSVEQPMGSWTGLRLSTTRQEMLWAVVESLSQASARRVDVLRKATPHRLKTDVLRTGGTGEALGGLMYRAWPRFKTPWRFADVPEATLLGLGRLAQGHPV